ncbi:uncharacterized protein LOC102721609 [Oryza brachyantha]|uniref:uncharacterized protein LOC102721609 n=1 Tax=Oryza brachyantha TaxID=4533 RepID=UPI001ADD3284|nr:uncharacterized protein LOC102721609 [Oryza brachyantha]
MGNAAPRMRHIEATAAATMGGRRGAMCCKKAEATNAPAASSAVARKRPDEKSAGRGGAGAEHSAAAATGVTVKVVLRRKDAERLIARLNEQNAMGRKARMAEIKNELKAGVGGAAASPARRRDARTRRLAPIQEN